MNIKLDLKNDLNTIWGLDYQDKNYKFLYYENKELKKCQFFLPNITGHKYYLILSSLIRKKYAKIINRIWKSISGYQPGLLVNRKTGEVQLYPIEFSFQKLDNVVLEGILGNHSSLSSYKIFSFYQAHFNFNGKNKSIYYIKSNKLTEYLDTLKVYNNQFISIFQKCYHTKYLEHFISSKMKTYYVSINGLNFVNTSSNQRLLWIFSNTLEKPVKSILDTIDWDNLDHNDIMSEYNTLIKKWSGSIKKKYIFALKKGNSPDCYEMFAISNIYDDSIELIHFDNAYIATSELSKKINSIFDNEDIINFECLFNNERKKWIPIKQSSKKLTTYKTIIQLFN